MNSEITGGMHSRSLLDIFGLHDFFQKSAQPSHDSYRDIKLCNSFAAVRRISPTPATSNAACSTLMHVIPRNLSLMPSECC